MIQLDGVSIPTVDRKFFDFQAYDHQAISQDRIAAGEPFFAVNESPTGSGKTLSWLKPALDEQVDTIAVYPTNALVADQVDTVRSIVAEQYDRDQVGVVGATGETIATWRSEYGVRSKGEALAKRIEKSFVRNETTILLTNPDTLVIVRKGMYHHRFVSSKFDRFRLVVLDEFHLADVKQQDTLLFLIDEMYELPANQSRTDQFYFLSATPEGDNGSGRSLFTRLSNSVGVDVDRISAEKRPTSRARIRDNWRSVMPEVDLTLKESQTFRTAQTLLADDLVDGFVKFCQEGKTVVMLDGVHEVDLVYEVLNERIDAKVRRITGFHKGNVSSKIIDFNVLISNSAVEVGLDFKPDRLVFSAHNSPALIQRLGRLRAKETEQPLCAWCFVPGPVRASIETQLNHASQDRRLPRNAFEEAVAAAFTQECDLSSFSRRWGELEAFQHVWERVENIPSEAEREVVMDRGLDRIRRHYYGPYDRQFDQTDLKRLHEWTDHDLIDELKSYRGSGLQVMIKDHTDGLNSMKLYDVFYLLRRGKVEFFSSSEFKSQLSEKEIQYYDTYSPYAVGFCVYKGNIPTDPTSDTYSGRSVAFHAESKALHDMKNTSDIHRKPTVVGGLAINIDDGEAPPVEGRSYLRDEIAAVERLCYVVPGHNSTVKATYGLGDFFFLYPLGEDSVAIGLDALYLHCLVQDQIKSTDREWGWDD